MNESNMKTVFMFSIEAFSVNSAVSCTQVSRFSGFD